jgi:hypothetical protein
MAITVFPETNDVATTADWHAMAAVINRGEINPITALTSTSDTDRLIYKGQTSGSLSSTAITARQWIPDFTIAIGEVWSFEMSLEITRMTIDVTQNDLLNLIITVPTGLHMHAAYMSQRITPSPANPISGSINITGTGVTETISYGYLGSEAVESMILSISGVLIGETAGGTVEVDYLKASDVYSTTYQGGESHVICRRILG